MDGKNREEQENGAKVRDLEEYKAENRKRKRRRRITVGILAGAILAAGIGTGVWIQLRTFQGYDTLQATETEDTDTYMFQKSGNKIVRYGIDGIELRDRKNQTLWSDHYTMENPQMISCGDAIAIYDKNGTKIVVYDADGKAGEITASYPIVKARLIISPVNSHKGSIIDDTVIAQSFPNIYQDQNKGPILGRSVPGDWLFSQRGQQCFVNETGVTAEKGIHQVTDHHDRDEERYQNGGLIQLFRPAGMDFVEQDSHSNGEHRTQYNKRHVVENGITGDNPCVFRLEQKFKVFQPDKRTAPHALGIVELLKGNADSGHGDIVVDDEIDRSRHHHQIEGKICLQLSSQALFLFDHQGTSIN